MVLALAGCSGVQEPAQTTQRRMPAMPTMRTAAGEAAARVSEQESFANAQRLARAGDMAGAVRAIARAGDWERGRQRSLELARELAASDPLVAERWALALPTGTTQAEALEVAAKAFVQRDAAGALSWALQRREGLAGGLVRRAVAAELARIDPRRAVEQLQALPATSERDEMLTAAAGAWARQDANGAVAWAQGLADETLRRRMVTSVGFELAQMQPDRALEVVELLPAGRERWLLTGAVAQTWVIKDPKAAFAWAQALPAGDAREAAYAGFDTGLGVPSKRRIASAPNTRGGSSRTRGGVGAGAIVRDGDLPSFELWLRGQREGISREEAILEYVRQRGAAEPRAIGQWLTTLPPGATRDRATELHVESVLAVSPREAAGLLQTLPRSEQTPEMLERTAKRLLITDPAAAAVWIEQSYLPEYRKQELLREAGR